MRRNSGSEVERVTNRHTSRFGKHANGAESLEFLPVSRGQSCPQHCPHRDGASTPADSPTLGGPLDIEDVAMLLGCSVWTIRQRYLPRGLPHIRASARGRFVFFREQVIDWILERQRKGGR
jgi:hypothetical protein